LGEIYLFRVSIKPNYEAITGGCRERVVGGGAMTNKKALDDILKWTLQKTPPPHPRHVRDYWLTQAKMRRKFGWFSSISPWEQAFS